MEFIKSLLEWCGWSVLVGVVIWLAVRGIGVAVLAASLVIFNPFIIIIPCLMIWLGLTLFNKMKKK